MWKNVPNVVYLKGGVTRLFLKIMKNTVVSYWYLVVGDTVRQLPGQPHQLEAITEGTIFEVSTQHFDSDSYRVWKGDVL